MSNIKMNVHFNIQLERLWSKFLKVTILYSCDVSRSHSMQQAQIQARFSVGSEIFLLLGGPGHAPSENFENQVSQIGGNWITNYLF